MVRPRLAREVSSLALLLLLALVAPAAERLAAEESSARVFHGACYCRAAGQLQCRGDLTEAECNKSCAEALCDEWFWLERRPCWNWGYGG